MCIRWGNVISPSFTVSNGVKQGHIISPILFNVYMGGLSVLLNSSNMGGGGQIGHTFLNHLCYADDLCLIKLSSVGMQKLLNLCSKYAFHRSLSCHAKKSFSTCFIPGIVKISKPQLYFRHDISPVFTGIPVFLSCQRSFLWKSQNRFKHLGDFYGGGGVYLLGDLIDLLLSRLNTLLQCFINPSHMYSQSTHCL